MMPNNAKCLEAAVAAPTTVSKGTKSAAVAKTSAQDHKVPLIRAEPLQEAASTDIDLEELVDGIAKLKTENKKLQFDICRLKKPGPTTPATPSGGGLMQAYVNPHKESGQAQQEGNAELLMSMYEQTRQLAEKAAILEEQLGERKDEFLREI